MRLIVNQRILNLSTPQIMGILNVTPDSFFDGGEYCTIPKAIDHVSKMIKHGSTLIDIGGESTRPGASVISDEQEADRVIPIVREVLDRFDIFVSVNTSSALVIRESATIGAHMINDIRSLSVHGSMQAAVDCKLLVCLMHMQGTPNTMQKAPVYTDVVREVNAYFTQQIIRCNSAGIDRARLVLDPGFGFGKYVHHNYQLLANLTYFHHFNLPILVGISRKSMLDCNNRYSSYQRLIGSVSGAVIAAMQGVHIIRVHDVKETMQAMQIVESTVRQQR